MIETLGNKVSDLMAIIGYFAQTTNTRLTFLLCRDGDDWKHIGNSDNSAIFHWD